MPLGVPSTDVFTSHVIGVRPDPARLAALADTVVRGALQVRIDSIVGLDLGPDAFRTVESGRATGKVVLRP